MVKSRSTTRAAEHVRQRRRASSLLVVVIVLAVGQMVAESPHLAAAAEPPPSKVVVSLTWDDGRASQTGSLAIQAKYGYPATYYINSVEIGAGPGKLTKGQLDVIASSGGNEIGGHTDHHVDLTALSSAQATAEVCNDRNRLVGWYGSDAGRSFAYPFGAVNSTAKAAVQSCGYQSARGVGGLRGVTSCQACPFTESNPPGDPLWLLSVSSVLRTTTLTALQQRVLQAEAAGGGWLVYVLHDLGVPPSDPGYDYSVDPVLYDQFLAWLSTRANVEVRTVADTLAGPPLPAPPPPPDPAQNILQNSDLERDDNANGVSDCWQRAGYGTNTASWSRVGGAHSGLAAEQVTITSWASGDRKLVTQQDSGTCAPAVSGGAAYTLSAWYQSTVPVAMVAYYRDTGGTWRYWWTGPQLPPSTNWVQAVRQPPALPPDATSLSFGIALTQVGTLRVDDLMLNPLAPPPPDTSPPQVSLTQPLEGSQVAGNVLIGADATDDRTVAKVDFFVGSQLIGSDSAAPYVATWDSRSVADGPVTVSARATDGAGLVSSLSSRTVHVLNDVPVSAVVNPSLEAVGSDGTPTCFSRTGYGTNSFTWTHTNDAHTGNGAERVDLFNRTTGDRKLTIKMDGGQGAGGCAPDVTPGHAYALTTWYKSTVPTALVVYYRTAAGAWVYWQTGPTLPAAAGWTSTTYVTPSVPADATAISFGIAITTPGTLVVDDFSLAAA